MHDPEPYAFPTRCLPVQPQDYAPFVDASVRAEIVRALRNGRAVLGEHSAGSGASTRRRLIFRTGSVRVGAVVPDDAVGWSEMLVNREVGVGSECPRALPAGAAAGALDAAGDETRSTPPSATTRSASTSWAGPCTCAQKRRPTADRAEGVLRGVRRDAAVQPRLLTRSQPAWHRNTVTPGSRCSGRWCHRS